MSKNKMAIRKQRHQLTDEERSSCCSWECVTKVFAWFSLALNVAGILAWIAIIATTLIGILGPNAPDFLVNNHSINFSETPINKAQDDQDLEDLEERMGKIGMFVGVAAMVLASVAMLMIFSVSLIFNGFLCNGVNNKKPEHVFVYFVYGVVMECLSVMATAWLATHKGFVELVASYAVCCICYLFFLVAVWKTYKKYKQIKDDQLQLLDHM